MFFGEGYTPNWFEEVFVIKTRKNTVPWTLMLVMILMKEKLLKTCYVNELQKQIKKIQN